MSGLATLSVLYVGLTDECMEFQGVLGASEFPPVRPEVRKLGSRWPEVSFSYKVIICFLMWECLFLNSVCVTNSKSLLAFGVSAGRRSSLSPSPWGAS